MAEDILVANSNVPQLTSDKCVVSKLEATLFHAKEKILPYFLYLLDVVGSRPQKFYKSLIVDETHLALLFGWSDIHLKIYIYYC
jgi:hypothetical protein